MDTDEIMYFDLPDSAFPSVYQEKRGWGSNLVTGDDTSETFIQVVYRRKSRHVRTRPITGNHYSAR